MITPRTAQRVMDLQTRRESAAARRVVRGKRWIGPSPATSLNDGRAGSHAQHAVGADTGSKARPGGCEHARLLRLPRPDEDKRERALQNFLQDDEHPWSQHAA